MQEESGSLGLDASLAWTQARYVARTAATPMRSVPARLDEAAGSILATALSSAYDEPFADAAAYNGYAVCGEGPWSIVDLAPDVALSPHTAQRVRAGQILPGHTDSVLRVDRAVLDVDASIDQVTAKDPLTDLPEPTARPDLGEGIVRQGSIRKSGSLLVPAHTRVTAGTLALAAAAGLDTIDVISPPVVGTLVLGASLLTSGPARNGRVRDALGWTIPAFVGALGARANPPVRAPDTANMLIQEIDDSNADILITTGSTSPEGGNLLREVLKAMGAHWLIDGILVTPGAQTLLVRLPDGRLLLGLSGHPSAAIAGLITVAGPLIAGLRGELAATTGNSENANTRNDGPSHAVLASPIPPPEFDDDTSLAPVRLTRDRLTKDPAEHHPSAHPLPFDGPAGLRGWATADAIAVIPPGKGARGDVVDVVDVHGRPATL